MNEQEFIDNELIQALADYAWLARAIKDLNSVRDNDKDTADYATD